MITGDYPGTARAIARQIGLGPAELVITGPELEAMGDAELQERIGECNIFARVVPEQKLKLVRALKARGELVAMTGDGVNDAPALKAANIGVAMGQRGTDVAREAASLVLLDDDFSSIVAAVRLGRRDLRQPQEGRGLHLRRAHAHHRSDPHPAGHAVAADLLAGARGLPGVHHRPRLLGGRSKRSPRRRTS